MVTMDVLISSLAERPDLAPYFDNFPDSWPKFMYHDVVSEHLFDLLVAAHPESNLIAVDSSDPASPVARTCAFPFSWPTDPDHGLPAGGYDQVLLRGAADLINKPARGRIAAALEVTIRPDQRGHGRSAEMLSALRHALSGLGYESLVVPVRPNEKHRYPHEPMQTYIERTRPDGLPADPWLRTHVRLGASIVGIAATSMTVTAPLDDWRRWTSLPFETDGPVIVPLALVPVHCDLANGVATYVEPNVWVHHRLTGPAS